MGSGIDAVGQSADYRGMVRVEFANEAVGVVASVGGGTTGAYDSDRTFGIEVGGAEEIEQGWAVVGFGTVEAGGVVGRGEEEGTNMVLFTEAELFFSTGESTFV